MIQGRSGVSYRVEAVRGTSESLGVWRGCAEESTGVVARNIVYCNIDDIINVCMIAASQEALSICTTLGDCMTCVIRSLVLMPHLRRHSPNKHVHQD